MTSNDDNFHASSPIVDLTEQGCHTSYISGPTFSGTPAWTGSAPVSPDDIRHYTPSFEGEEFDEGRTAFSEVFSNSLEPNASEPSPRFEPFSHEPDMMSGFGGSDFNMYWYDHSLEDHMEWQSAPVSKNVLLPQAHTRSASVELCGSSGSQPHVLEDIFIGEPLIPTTYESNQPRSESRLYGRGASFGDYVQGGVTEPAAYEGKASLPFNPPTDPRSTHDGFDSPETWDQPPATHSLDLPPVTISPCSRPCSPPTNSRFTMAPILPSPGLPRKRHYSESAGTWSRPASHRDTLIVDTPLLCCSPSPVSENGSPCPQRRIHTALSMVKRHTKKERKQCSYCSDHSVWKPGQKIQLDDLPPELLIEIFTFACSSLPVKRKWTCEHQKVGSTQSGVMRRSTMNGAFPNRHNAMEQGKQPDNMLVDFYQRKFNLPRHLRLLQARTIRALQLTCKKFCHIFTQYPNVDNILWKEATIACWGHLPKTLAEVQGWNKASQTCWRNVFGVFMRSDNGMFKKRNAGGVGGVESFGGKSGFKSAVLWHEEKRLRAEANKLQEQEAATLRAISAVAKGKQKEVEDTSVPSTLNAINRRRLLLVCPQPGPDVFTVKALPEGDGYELGLCLQNKVTIFIRLDEHGDFSKIKRALPHDLRRSKKGRFPSDCFEVVGNRFKVVKVERGKIFNHNVPDIDSLHHHQGTERMQRTMTWDLECVPEYANDKRASVARCEHQKEYLVFNIFASREGFIEGLDKPSEDSRVFCVMAKGIPAHAELPTTHAGGIPRVRTCPPQWKGKMRASGHDGTAGGPSGGLRTVFQWQRRFVYPRAQDFTISQRLHYMICNFKLNSTFAVVLIRWNIHSRVSYHEFVDRSFQVLDLATGAIVKVLQFPNFHWDFRHHDMTVEYNVMRYYKMRRMYNALHAGNRATRIHGDQFTLDDRGRLVSGSHDYCNWMWDLNAEIYDQWPRERVFTPLHNDAGNGDPFVVLDDFYWEGENRGDQEHTGAWDTSNERAGWWVKTPNQVLCFWHNVTTSRDGRWFAAVRAGRMFVWDLEDTTKVQGFSCALGTYMGPATESLVDGGKSATPTAPHPTVETRYLGKVLNARLEKKLRSWHVWNGIIPEQGLWLMYDDGKVVYLDRDDILDACGLAQEGKQWAFNRDDFGNLDTDSEDIGDSMNHDDEDESMEDSEDEENAVVFVNEKLPVPEARRKRRRTSTITSMASRGSSFIADEAGLVIDMSEQFMFDNELPDAETWEKMDDEGWLKRVRQENGSVMEGSSRA